MSVLTGYYYSDQTKYHFACNFASTPIRAVLGGENRLFATFSSGQITETAALFSKAKKIAFVVLMILFPPAALISICFLALKYFSKEPIPSPCTPKRLQLCSAPLTIAENPPETLFKPLPDVIACKIIAFLDIEPYISMLFENRGYASNVNYHSDLVSLALTNKSFYRVSRPFLSLSCTLPVLTSYHFFDGPSSNVLPENLQKKNFTVALKLIPLIQKYLIDDTMAFQWGPGTLPQYTLLYLSLAYQTNPERRKALTQALLTNAANPLIEYASDPYDNNSCFSFLETRRQGKKTKFHVQEMDAVTPSAAQELHAAMLEELRNAWMKKIATEPKGMYDSLPSTQEWHRLAKTVNIEEELTVFRGEWGYNVPSELTQPEKVETQSACLIFQDPWDHRVRTFIMDMEKTHGRKTSLTNAKEHPLTNGAKFAYIVPLKMLTSSYSNFKHIREVPFDFQEEHFDNYLIGGFSYPACLEELVLQRLQTCFKDQLVQYREDGLAPPV